MTLQITSIASLTLTVPWMPNLYHCYKLQSGKLLCVDQERKIKNQTGTDPSSLLQSTKPAQITRTTSTWQHQPCSEWHTEQWAELLLCALLGNEH